MVALPENAALALLDVRRTPRRVEMMQCHQLRLRVGARAHFLRRTQQDAHLAGTHVFEERQFHGVAIVVLDEGDFLGGHAARHELGFDILVNGKATPLDLRRG